MRGGEGRAATRFIQEPWVIDEKIIKIRRRRRNRKKTVRVRGKRSENRRSRYGATLP